MERIVREEFGDVSKGGGREKGGSCSGVSRDPFYYLVYVLVKPVKVW